MKETPKGKKVMISLNLGNFGSTGGIAREIAKEAEQAGYVSYTAFPREFNNRLPYVAGEMPFGTPRLCRGWGRLNRFLGFNGCYAWIETAVFLRRVRKLNPALLHLHNLHNSYINLPMLFRYIKKHRVPVVWTLHDCWAFTGQCPYFTLVNCDKWKTGCGECTQYREYPPCFFDRTKIMYRLKKRWFQGVENLTIVTPSKWLAGLAGESFLKEYPRRVINNGIDLSVFYPVESDFRIKRRLGDRYLLLGVAAYWGERKGLDVFIELARRLGQQYQIVLVGTDEAVERQLPEGVISIRRTQNREALAALYSTADLFVNPTREETFGMVNLEALACGTPAITFDTGGSPEIPDESCGMTVPWNDVDAMEAGIRNICQNAPYTKEACVNRARQFAVQDKYREYIALYDEILQRGNETTCQRH